MEAVIFCGLQASGKSSFFKAQFFANYMRISLDMLRTRNRENLLLQVCLQTQQRFVVDNTNPTRSDRTRYICQSRASGFQVTGYYFQSKVEDCLQRNRKRTSQVPEVAILGTAKKLERPSRTEGFDRLWYVRLENGQFVVEKWNDAADVGQMNSEGSN